jgi:hypothetical protein
VDLDFEDKMTEGELRSLCQQLSYCYSANCNAEKPFSLHFTSLKARRLGRLLLLLRSSPVLFFFFFFFPGDRTPWC